MNDTSIILRIAAVIMLAAAVSACGQRGPLYMPGDKPAKKSTANPVQNAPVILKAPEDAKPAEAGQPKAD